MGYQILTSGYITHKYICQTLGKPSQVNDQTKKWGKKEESHLRIWVDNVDDFKTHCQLS